MRQGSIVPNISFIREAVSDISRLVSLIVLLDGIQNLVFGDLSARNIIRRKETSYHDDNILLSSPK